jgi:hypothetical protein
VKNRSIEEQLAELMASKARLQAHEQQLTKEMVGSGETIHWGDENVAIVTPSGEVITFPILKE